MPDCVFCKIRDGQIPAMKVFEDARTICIMDINPLNPGHCLVLAKAHAATIYDAEIVDLQAAIVTAKRVALALKASLDPEGLNVLQANGPAAFQSVAHFDLHRAKDAADIVASGGEIIPPEDVTALKAMGVKEIFTPGASTQEIVRFVRDHIRAAA